MYDELIREINPINKTGTKNQDFKKKKKKVMSNEYRVMWAYFFFFFYEIMKSKSTNIG